VAEIVLQALERSGLGEALYRLGLDTESGIRGRYLPARLRQVVPLVQALVKAPQIAVLDISALLAISDEPGDMVAGLRSYCEGMTLFLLTGDANLVEDVPLRIVFHGATGLVEAEEAPGAANDAGDRGSRFAEARRMEARS
jgi:putative ABC transport system ATP-binding protein